MQNVQTAAGDTEWDVQGTVGFVISSGNGVLGQGCTGYQALTDCLRLVVVHEPNSSNFGRIFRFSTSDALC